MSQTLKLISKNRKTKRKSFIGLSIGFMILGSKQGIAGYEGVAARIGHFSLKQNNIFIMSTTYHINWNKTDTYLYVPMLSVPCSSQS